MEAAEEPHAHGALGSLQRGMGRARWFQFTPRSPQVTDPPSQACKPQVNLQQTFPHLLSHLLAMLSAFQFLFCFLFQVAELLSALGLVPHALHSKPFLQEYTHTRTHRALAALPLWQVSTQLLSPLECKPILSLDLPQPRVTSSEICTACGNPLHCHLTKHRPSWLKVIK